ncbi:hypothetical protein [Burkholderia pseudomallei]|uniref:hypothetical protein n=1 Tax=Burkholderia pseudomallei TaxID=28450 RepID=UPI00105D16DD|nr:hypothetical protein [Burkholderia pseudomallei]MDA0559696.1 hypothetical protein [Burkholderia pseudomallei]
MKQRMTALRISRGKQAGFLLAQMAIFVMLLSVVFAYAGHEYWTKTVNEGRDNRARLVGTTLAKIADATKTYETTYYEQIQRGQAITANGYTVPGSRVLTPTVADLNGLGFLPNWAVNPIVYNGQSIGFNVKIMIDMSTGCSIPACNLPFQITTTGPLHDPVNTVNVDIRRATIAAQVASPGNAGVAMPTSFGGNPAIFVTSNGTQIGTNPGSVAGLIAMTNNYDSQGFASFLRRDGTLPMTGDFNLQDTTGAKHNVNNAATVNAQQVVVPSGNNVRVGSAALYGDSQNIAMRAAPGGSAFAQDTNGNYVAFNAGDVNSNGNVSTSGNLTFSNGWAAATSAGRLHINSGENLYLQPWAAGQTVVGGGGGSGQLLVTGRLTGNEYIVANGWAPQGGACSTPGAIANSGNGPLFCQSGVWTPAGGGQAWRCVQYDSFWASGIVQDHYFFIFNSPSDVSSGSTGNGWVTTCRYS